ncbi:hypothetical protein [Carboxylicivirga sp. RSCT41]|uniref:hypothetical protein n=1 Tax=Carboxylicivirga agarovorans TaxID=3417570 RepID=UPI003D346C0C
MRQIVIATIYFSILCGCNIPIKKDTPVEVKNNIEKKTTLENQENESRKNNLTYREVKKNYIDSLMIDICSTQGIEFVDLYPMLDSIASDKYESLVLVDSLKMKGFKVTNWGRGNWMEGPRIVSITMLNEQCECKIDKLYYSTDQVGKYKVTERIKVKMPAGDTLS